MKKHFSTFKYVGVLAIVALALGLGIHKINASTATVTVTGISGFGWSDMPDTSNECLHGIPPNNTSCGSYVSDHTSGQVGRGAGWISMNGSAGTSSGMGGNVSINSTTGELHGYAWTPNMGWIRFDPTGPYPVQPTVGIGNAPNGSVPGGPVGPQTGGNGSQTVPANTGIPGSGLLENIIEKILGNQKAYATAISSKINLTSGTWEGWARACAVFQSGCDGALATSDVTGGWDGWISLSGDTSSIWQINHHYGVVSNMTTGATTGWAWGGDIMGWINFDNVRLLIAPLTCVGTDGNTYTYAQGTTPPPICSALLCSDPLANNVGSALPCTYDGQLCTDPLANNVGSATPCTYGICANPLATNYGQSGACILPIVTGLNGASATISQTNDCSTGTAVITWSTIGVSPMCQASTSGTSGITGFSGPVQPSGSATVHGIQQNGQANNFTITCPNLLPGYIHRGPVTGTTQVTCQIPNVCTDPAANNVGSPLPCTYGPGGPGSTGTPHPIYKEN